MWTYLDKIYECTVYVFAIWGAEVRSLNSYCGLNIEPYYFKVCGYRRSPQTLVEICRDMGICGAFRVVSVREKYPGFILLSTPFKIDWKVYLTMHGHYSLNGKTTYR